MTDSNEIKMAWTGTKEKLLKKFAVLTDRDLVFEEGKQDELINRIQLKIGRTKEEIKKLIEEL
jgi:uncharacterized protein YjbJ (UPF0337 family)